MAIESHNIPVISTPHLTVDVAEALTNQRNNNPWAPCADWEHGFFLCLERIGRHCGEPVAAPRCLSDIREWLIDNGFNSCWVRLDSDGPTVGDLPSYEWP